MTDWKITIDYFLNKTPTFLLSFVAYSLAGHSCTLVSIERVSWKILQENVFMLLQPSIQAQTAGLYWIFISSRYWNLNIASIQIQDTNILSYIILHSWLLICTSPYKNAFQWTTKTYPHLQNKMLVMLCECTVKCAWTITAPQET